MFAAPSVWMPAADGWCGGWATLAAMVAQEVDVTSPLELTRSGWTLQVLPPLLVIGLGCTPTATPSTTSPAAPAASSAPPSTAPAPAAPPPSATATPALPGAVLAKRGVLRIAPSPSATIKDAYGQKQRNIRMDVARGELVTVLGEQGDWREVKSITHGVTGWVERTALLPGDASALATVLAIAPVFSRPSSDAGLPDQTIEPGALLIVVGAEGAFREVQVEGGSRVWMRHADLDQSDTEVAIARVASRVRWYRWARDTGTEATFAIENAMRATPSSRLARILDRFAVPNNGRGDGVVGSVPLEDLSALQGAWVEVSPDWSAVFVACGSAPTTWELTADAHGVALRTDLDVDLAAKGLPTFLHHFETGGQDTTPYVIREAHTNESRTRFWLSFVENTTNAATTTERLELKWADRSRGRLWIKREDDTWLPHVEAGRTKTLRREVGDCVDDE
jgi:hypothetical protein